jgi:hypothetical protein
MSHEPPGSAAAHRKGMRCISLISRSGWSFVRGTQDAASSSRIICAGTISLPVSGGTPTQDFGINGCRDTRTDDLPLYNAMCWRDSWIAGSVLEAHWFVKRSGNQPG